MKSHLLRSSSIAGVLLLLVAFALSGIAQQRQSVEQQEPQMRELAVQGLDSETLRIVVPRECTKKPIIQQHTVASLSPALTSFLTGKPHKGYNNPAVDTVFGDSFKIDSCRVCYATLEVRVRHQPGAWSANASNYSNDTILAGAGPFSTNLRFIGPAPIWPNGTLPNPYTLTLGTTSAGLNNLNSYLFNNTPAWVDVIAQDDTAFDYAKLSVWYY
jgi:hypothetical protein